MTVSLYAIIKKVFPSTPLTEAKLALKEWKIAYTKQKDGTIVVEGDIDIRNKGLTKLPDLTKIIIKGNFWCSDNQLTSLSGAPTSVRGSFWCNNNQLISLTGAPASIDGSFFCYDNQLTSLEGAPASVGWNFYCSGNQLTSLEGAPASVGGVLACHENQLTCLTGAPAYVGGDFLCFNNQLSSLTGAPASIGGDFFCINNQLTSLEGSPQKFKTLRSDLGDFTSWDEVPEHLRISPETKEKERLRAENFRQEMHGKIAAAGEKKQAFKPMPSIRFKAGPK